MAVISIRVPDKDLELLKVVESISSFSRNHLFLVGIRMVIEGYERGLQKDGMPTLKDIADFHSSMRPEYVMPSLPSNPHQLASEMAD